MEATAPRSTLGPLRPAWAAAAGLVLVLLVVAAPAAAWREADAPALRADVLEAWHSPTIVAPHTQFTAHLRLAPGSNVTTASFQVCETRLFSACFAPPHPATRDGDVLTLDTSTYLAAGQPIDFQPGWTLGIKWILQEGSTSVAFPEAPAACAAPCIEPHYFLIDVAAESDSHSSPPLALAPILALAVALCARRTLRA